MSELIDKLRMMYSHRGDGISTQYVNPNGPEAADRIERLEAGLNAILGWQSHDEGCDMDAEFGRGVDGEYDCGMLADLKLATDALEDENNAT